MRRKSHRNGKTGRQHQPGSKETNAPEREPREPSAAHADGEAGATDLPAAEAPSASPEQWRARAEEIARDDRHMGRVRRYAGGCIKRLAERRVYLGLEAEDLAQEAFVVVLDGRLEWDDDVEETVGSMLTVIKNQCRNLRRKIRRRHERDQQRKAVAPHSENPQNLEDLVMDVTNVSAQLPGARRSAFEAITIRDLHPADFAATRDITESTARKQNRDAKQFVIEMLPRTIARMRPSTGARLVDGRPAYDVRSASRWAFRTAHDQYRVEASVGLRGYSTRAVIRLNGELGLQIIIDLAPAGRSSDTSHVCRPTALQPKGG